MTVVQVFFCLRLIILSAVFLSLDLWLSAVCQTVVGLQWLILAYQRFRQRSVA